MGLWHFTMFTFLTIWKGHSRANHWRWKRWPLESWKISWMTAVGIFTAFKLSCSFAESPARSVWTGQHWLGKIAFERFALKITVFGACASRLKILYCSADDRMLNVRKESFSVWNMAEKRFSPWKVIFSYKKSFGALIKQGNNVQLLFYALKSPLCRIFLYYFTKPLMLCWLGVIQGFMWTAPSGAAAIPGSYCLN